MTTTTTTTTTTTARMSTDLVLVGTYLDEIRDALGDNAARFTCSEIDALAALFALTGREDDAADLLAEHAEGEEDEDDHYGWDRVQCVEHVAHLLGHEQCGACGQVHAPDACDLADDHECTDDCGCPDVCADCGSTAGTGCCSTTDAPPTSFVWGCERFEAQVVRARYAGGGTWEVEDTDGCGYSVERGADGIWRAV